VLGGYADIKYALIKRGSFKKVGYKIKIKIQMILILNGL